ncbi:MAG: DMT family transporter [Candidatus Thorarchaeota archaeon]
MNDELLIGIVAGILSSLFFAIQNVVVKWMGKEVKPVFANSVKMWVSLPVMLLLAFSPFRSANFNMPPLTIVFLALSVLFGAAFGDFIYFASQARIGVSSAFAIANTYPIITYLLAITFLGEIFIFTRFSGAVLAVLGIAIIAQEQSKDPSYEETSTHKTRNYSGYALAVLTSIMYAIATIMIDSGVRNVDPIDANVIRLAFGSVFLVPLFYAYRRKGMNTPSKRNVRILTVVGVFGLAFASLLYVASIKNLGASLGAILGSIAPLLALPFSIWLLDEIVNWKVALGTIISILGIWLTIIAI